MTSFVNKAGFYCCVFFTGSLVHSLC